MGGAGRAAPQGQTPRGATPSASRLPGLIFLRKKREQSCRPGQPPRLWRCQDDVPRGFGVMAPGGAGRAARSLRAHRLGRLPSLLLRSQPCCGATNREAAGNKPLPTPFLQSQRSVMFGPAWSLVGALGKYLRDQGLRELQPNRSGRLIGNDVKVCFRKIIIAIGLAFHEAVTI